MTFLVFMMGVTLVLNGCVGWIAWQVVLTSRAERAALERTRLECAAMVRELERIKALAAPMRIVPEGERKPISLSVLIGAALRKYEVEAEAAAMAADAIAIGELAA